MLTALFLSLFSAADVKARIAEDVATVHEDGKMTADSYKICKKKDGSSKQVHLSAEAAPGTGISRDKFVFFYAAVGTMLTENLGDCKGIAEPVGEADLDMKIFMASSGLQFVITADGETQRHSSTWEDL